MTPKRGYYRVDHPITDKAYYDNYPDAYDAASELLKLLIQQDIKEEDNIEKSIDICLYFNGDDEESDEGEMDWYWFSRITATFKLETI